MLVSTIPSGRNLKPLLPEMSTFFEGILNFLDAIRNFRVSRHGVKYDSVLQKPNGNDLQRISNWLEEGKLKPAVGKVVKFGDIQGIKDVCNQIASNKGGIGKTVVQIEP